VKVGSAEVPQALNAQFRQTVREAQKVLRNYIESSSLIKLGQLQY
jgi:hypothetical protein